jgi:hypothetical protein
MSTRLFISLFLLGVGVGSPWLVRDWLDGRAEEKRSSSLSEGMTSLSDRVKNRSHDEEAALPAVEKVIEVSSEHTPYPLAAKAQRIMQGFLSSPSAGEKVPFLSNGKVPTTPRTSIITKDVGKRLQGDLAALALQLGDPVYLRVFKEESELELWMKTQHEPHYVLFKVFRLTHCAGEPGPKLREGDGQAPEGFYFASSGSMLPETRHHLGIDLGFPNAYDTECGYTGSDLMIHGGVNAAGAFALSPQDMEEVYTVAEAGLAGGQKLLRINVFPFRMTDKRMDQAWKGNPACLEFWMNLKEGYDFFENVRLPPVVEVESGRYAFRME